MLSKASVEFSRELRGIKSYLSPAYLLKASALAIERGIIPRAYSIFNALIETFTDVNLLGTRKIMYQTKDLLLSLESNRG